MAYILDKNSGRRKFIKTTVLTAGTFAAAGITGCSPSFGSTEHKIEYDEETAQIWGRSAGEWIPSCCNMCGGQSGIFVHVVNGIVDKIEPNNWNPVNYSNISTDFFDGYTEALGCAEGGVICPKGNSGIMQLYDPDRIKKPLKRTNKDRGLDIDPQWIEITMDQALDEIALKLQKIRDNNESHKLLWISEDHSFTHIQDDFCKLFGTPNYSMHSNLCDVARKASFKAVMGHERPLTDFINSKYILLFGWNPTSAIKWVYLPRILTRGIERGAKLVVVDPYLSDTAAKGHDWLAVRPGTDGALALAIGHVILRDGLEDKEFLYHWCSGVEEYREYVRDKTPEWAESITSVPSYKIEQVARELATVKPALVDSWSGPGQHSNGVQGGRAIAILNALIGSIDVSGGLLIPSNTGNKHIEVQPEPIAEAGYKMPRFDESTKYPLSHKSGVYTQLFNNIIQEKGPYKPDSLFCIFQNPVMSLPGGEKSVLEALKKLELSVVVDTMMSETALLADYVLPGTVYLERYDLNTQWVTWPAVGLRQPVIKPLFDQLAEYEIVTALGRRLKLKNKSGNLFFNEGPLSGANIESLTKWYEEYLSKELMNGGPGITLEELKELPGAVWVDKKGTEYQKYSSEIEKAVLKNAYYDGDKNKDGTRIFDKPGAENRKLLGVVHNRKAVRGFATATGKVELNKPSLGKMSDANGMPVNTLPEYRPRDWRPDRDYPFYLINWKEASHTHTRTQNNAWLLDIKNKNPLIINFETAARLKIKDGDEVWVESPYGKILTEAKVSRRIHPEVVGAMHGFGHKALGKQAKGKGSNFGILNITKSDPLAGMAIHKEVCVNIYKA